MYTLILEDTKTLEDSEVSGYQLVYLTALVISGSIGVALDEDMCSIFCVFISLSLLVIMR